MLIDGRVADTERTQDAPLCNIYLKLKEWRHFVLHEYAHYKSRTFSYERVD